MCALKSFTLCNLQIAAFFTPWQFLTALLVLLLFNPGEDEPLRLLPSL